MHFGTWLLSQETFVTTDVVSVRTLHGIFYVLPPSEYKTLALTQKLAAVEGGFILTYVD